MSFGKILDIFSTLFKGGNNTTLPVVVDGPAPTPPVTEPSPSGFLAPIPVRSDSAVTGSQFMQDNLKLSGSVREKNIINELVSGNVPDFMRSLKEVNVSSAVGKITFYVMPDYMCIGTNEDYVRIPMSPLSAQIVADAFECTLPTRKMVNDIWKNAKIKLPPLPWGPPYNAEMESTDRYQKHNAKIQQQLNGKDFTQLIAGHKKDVVLTNRLAPNNPKRRVAIYGWFNSDGTVIQGLNPTSHEDAYADYSHGLRFVSKKVLVNGVVKDIVDVFKDSQLCALLSDEGVLNFVRY